MDGRPKLGAMKRQHGWLGEMVASGGAVLLFHILSRHHPDNLFATASNDQRCWKNAREVCSYYIS